MDRELEVRQSRRMDTIGLGLIFQQQCLVCYVLKYCLLFLFILNFYIFFANSIYFDLLLGDMGQVYLYNLPYFCLISIIVVAIVVPAQCYRVLIYVINL